MRRRSFLAGIMLALALASVQVAFAQESAAAPSGARNSAEIRHRRLAMRLERMALELGLTTEQKAQIEPVLAAQWDDTRALRLDTSVSPEDKQARLEQLQQDYNLKIRSALNAEQQGKFDRIRERNRQRAIDTRPQKRKGTVRVVDDDQ